MNNRFLNFLLNRSTKRLMLLVVLFICVSNESQAQLDSIHYFPPVHCRQNSQIAEQYAYLSTPEVTPFDVTIVDGAGNLIGTVTISKDNPNSILLGVGQSPATNTAVPIDSCAVVLKASGFIASAPYDFYCNVRMKAANHATSVACKGRAALGKVFYAGSMPQVVSNNNRNFVTSVMATENGTIVTVNGYNPGVVFQSGPGPIYADALTFFMNAGDCFVLTGYTTTSVVNMTGFIGAKITATKNIVVNTGNYLGSISPEGFQDAGMVQIVPTALLGKEHAVVAGGGGTVLERPLVVAITDGTNIFLNNIVAPVTTLNEGDYYLIPESYYAGPLHDNMGIRSSQPVYVFQATAANTSSATSEFNFIPPLACYLTREIDAIPDIDRIGPTVFSGILYIITASGSAVTINGSGLPASAGPQAVLGLPDWQTYKVSMGGDVKIQSTGAMAAGYISVNGNAGAGAYYAGFNFEFQVDAGPDLEVCEGDEVILYGTGPPEVASYAWDSGVLDSVAFIPAATAMYELVGADISGCEDNDSVLVTVHVMPTSNAGLDQELCDTNATTLVGNTPLITGSGLWTMAAGPGIVTFEVDSIPTTDVSDLIEGTYTFVWTVGNGNCPTVSDTLLVTVYDQPSANAGPDQELCDSYSTVLEGIAPIGTATGLWTMASGPGAPGFADPTNPNTAIGGLVEGTYELIWTVSNGTCTSAADTVLINVFEFPTSDAGEDQSLCDETTADLEGNIFDALSSGLWTMESGPGAVTFSDATSPFSSVSGLVEGEYYFVWTVSKGSCAPAKDTILVQVFNMPTANAGLDQDLCEVESTDIIGNAPLGTATGEWTYVAGPGAPTILDITDPTTSVSDLFSGTTTLVWTVINGTCPSVSDTVLINIRAYPVINFEANQVYGCEPMSVAFTNLSAPLGDDCLWNFGDGSSETGCGDVLHVYAEGTFDVSLTVTANGCTTTETFSDYITVIPLPIADFTALPSQISISNTLVTFDNSSNHATTYFWSFGDDGASSTEFEPSHLYPEALGGVYEVVLIATNDLGCADTAYATIVYQDQLIFYVPNIFTPNGDGMNDVFNPSFTGRINPADFNMKIFNRWGEVIYDTYDINAGWNGKYLELLVEDGVYIWRVEFGDSTNGERYTFEGHVTILK